MKRIFIAVDISDEAQLAAAAHTERIRHRSHNVRVSWVRPENMHVTMKFLGDVDERRLESVKNAVSKSVEGIGPFQAGLSSPEAFGKRVLAIAIDDVSGNLGLIQTRIERGCSQIGFKEENRRFRAHLTIGRIRDVKGTASLTDAHTSLQIEPVSFEVDHVTIYESTLLSTGSVYSRLVGLQLAT